MGETTMKSYTDIEQSRKLAEILPIESADQTWERIAIAGANLDVPEEMEYWHNGNTPYILNSKIGIPCWSLAALLDILPETIDDETHEYELRIDMIDKKPKYVILGDCYHSDFPSWDWDNKELLDNVVESVIWLNNNGYLRSQLPTNEFV